MFGLEDSPWRRSGKNLTYYFYLFNQPIKVPDDLLIYLLVRVRPKQYYIDKIHVEKVASTDTHLRILL